jgi:pyrroline-5-carboxylate reductase
MDIILIGSGNAATVLGRKSKAAGHRIVQVYSRNGSHANQLASRLGAVSTSYISTIERNADLMIIAIRDEALVPFVRDLGHVNSGSPYRGCTFDKRASGHE